MQMIMGRIDAYIVTNADHSRKMVSRDSLRNLNRSRRPVHRRAVRLAKDIMKDSSAYFHKPRKQNRPTSTEVSLDISGLNFYFVPVAT
jgi:hypothetical protein